MDLENRSAPSRPRPRTRPNVDRRGLMAVAFFAFITVLSWAEVSFVVPATAANYIVGALGAKFLLSEQVSRVRWAGMLLVAAGVALACAAH